MENFYSLLLAMGVSCVASEDKMDILGSLPPEIAVIILRTLDSRSLLAAAFVSFRWFSLCKSDRVLRKRIREEMKRQKEQRVNPLSSRLTFIRDAFRPFASRNKQLKARKRPIEELSLVADTAQGHGETRMITFEAKPKKAKRSFQFQFGKKNQKSRLMRL